MEAGSANPVVCDLLKPTVKEHLSGNAQPGDDYPHETLFVKIFDCQKSNRDRSGYLDVAGIANSAVYFTE